MPGVGNISNDPMFRDVTNHDYRLADNSPCLNAADDGYNMGAYLGVWKQPPDPDTLNENSLKQNSPNPFNNNTFITYRIFSQRNSEHVTLKIYNIQGQLIRTLVSERKTNGLYVAYWNGRDERGQGVCSGYYFCHLRVGINFSETIKMLWLRPNVEE